MHVEPRHGVSELEKAARREKDARVAIRVRAVVLAMKGRDAPTIAEDLDRSRRGCSSGFSGTTARGSMRCATRPGPASSANSRPSKSHGSAPGSTRGPITRPLNAPDAGRRSIATSNRRSA